MRSEFFSIHSLFQTMVFRLCSYRSSLWFADAVPYGDFHHPAYDLWIHRCLPAALWDGEAVAAYALQSQCFCNASRRCVRHAAIPSSDCGDLTAHCREELRGASEHDPDRYGDRRLPAGGYFKGSAGVPCLGAAPPDFACSVAHDDEAAACTAGTACRWGILLCHANGNEHNSFSNYGES